MPGKDLTWFEKLKGKRYGDIELPSEGDVDPRLKGTTTREALEKAGKNFKELQRKNILRGLREAAEGDSKK